MAVDKYAEERALGALSAIHDRELQTSALAASKATDADVKDFAKKMTKHHSRARKQQDDLARTLGLETAESRQAKAVTDETANALSRLSQLGDADFDAEYIDQAIADHQSALALLDNFVVPALQASEMRELVEGDVQPMLRAHLTQARDLALRFAPRPAALTSERPMRAALP